MERIDRFKAALSALAAALTALWGWFGWLVLGWVAAMALDYVTGSCAALKSGAWSSKVAREGIWHKMGSVCAVALAGLLDLVLGQLAGRLELPFAYSVFLCPLVVVWYILTEAGSIAENAGALGAPIPGFLRKAIADLKDQTGEEGRRP